MCKPWLTVSNYLRMKSSGVRAMPPMDGQNLALGARPFLMPSFASFRIGEELFPAKLT